MLSQSWESSRYRHSPDVCKEACGGSDLQEFPDTEKTDDHSEKHDETDAQDGRYRHTGPAALCSVLCKRGHIIPGQLAAAAANSPRCSSYSLQLQ